MKYIAHLKESGEGCDYTIGCGHIIIEIEAEDFVDAQRKLKIEVLGEWSEEYGNFDEGYWGEQALKKVVLYEISQFGDMPHLEWYRIGQEKKDNFKKSADKKSEQAEYERLKKKFETP